MKSIISAALMFAAAFCASAQNEILTITMVNGTEHTFNVAEISEMTFGAATMADQFAGAYTGTQKVTVGGAFTYETTVTYTLTAEADGTVTVAIPSYTLTGTMMGDLTLGALTIPGLSYDYAKGGFFRDYGSDGLQQHFKAVNNGVATMDADYTLNPVSTILITANGANAIAVENPFKLGAMPLPLTAAFEGTK